MAGDALGHWPVTLLKTLLKSQWQAEVLKRGLVEMGAIQWQVTESQRQAEVKRGLVEVHLGGCLVLVGNGMQLTPSVASSNPALTAGCVCTLVARL